MSLLTKPKKKEDIIVEPVKKNSKKNFTLPKGIAKNIIFISIPLIISIFFIISAAVFFYNTNNKELTKEEEAKQTIEKLAKIYNLPDQNPTLATIVDIEVLKKENQEFYKDALNGDSLVIFKDQQIAIIYRKDEDRIIKIGFANLDEKPQE